MAEPSFDALCEALKFPDLRVRFTTGLPTAKPPRLLGLRIVGHKGTDNTFFDDTVLGFSDNLTCLIGPRGCGKSAMIDGLRYLMGYNRTLNQIPKVAGQVKDQVKGQVECFVNKTDIAFRVHCEFVGLEDAVNYCCSVFNIESTFCLCKLNCLKLTQIE